MAQIFRATELQSYRVTELQNYRVEKTQDNLDIGLGCCSLDSATEELAWETGLGHAGTGGQATRGRGG